MKKRDRHELGRYVRACADLMELRDWTLHVHVTDAVPEVDDEEHAWAAVCEPIPGRKHAEISFRPSLRDEALEDVRQTVAHELVHCHTFGMWDQVRRDLLRPLGQQTYDVFAASFERSMEVAVDALAEAIAPRLPLIDWPS